MSSHQLDLDLIVERDMIVWDDMALHGAIRSIEILSMPSIERFYPLPMPQGFSPPSPCHLQILSLLSTSKNFWTQVWCDPSKRKAIEKEEGSTAARDNN